MSTHHKNPKAEVILAKQRIAGNIHRAANDGLGNLIVEAYAPLIAKIAEDSGIQALSMHGRTRACLYKGDAEYDTIANVKQIINHKK